MDQRRLRLGDILDDYCPRERRVTNHAVVAMIEEDVKQTRCTTCDAEHAYKGGKAPRRRKKDPTAVLYQEVLAGMPDAPELVSPAPGPADPAIPLTPEAPLPEIHAAEGTHVDEPAEVPESEEPVEEPQTATDDGPFHRRLIRATLPRPEGQKDVRQIPEFTIRQNAGRTGHNAFRGGSKMRGHSGGGNGSNRPQGAGRRFGTGGHGPQAPGRGGRPGFGGGNPQRQGAPGRNRKRSR